MFKMQTCLLLAFTHKHINLLPAEIRLKQTCFLHSNLFSSIFDWNIQY